MPHVPYPVYHISHLTFHISEVSEVRLDCVMSSESEGKDGDGHATADIAGRSSPGAESISQTG